MSRKRKNREFTIQDDIFVEEKTPQENLGDFFVRLYDIADQLKEKSDKDFLKEIFEDVTNENVYDAKNGGRREVQSL